MTEFGFIDRIKDLFATLPDNGFEGIGDDCAVLPVGGGESLVFTTDMLAEGVHFLRTATSARELGRKSLAVNLSDVASMGARPIATLLSLSLPDDATGAWAEEFMQGYRELSQEFGVTLAGGDTTRSAAGITINVTAIGRAADFRHLSGSVQQDRECIVARRNRRAIGVTQILAQGQRIGAIALAILGFHQAGNHTIIEHVAALIAVPFYQMIAVQQRLHIQIAGIAAKRRGEEVAAQGRGGTHHQFVFPSGRHRTYRTERQHQCKKTCHYSFHGSFPFSVSDKCFQVSVNLSFRDLPRHALLRAGGKSAYSKHSPAFRYDLKPRLVSSSGITISPSPT